MAFTVDRLICKHCGHSFGADEAEETRVRVAPDVQDWSFWEFAVACPECESLDIDPIDFDNDGCRENPNCDGRCAQGLECPYHKESAND